MSSFRQARIGAGQADFLAFAAGVLGADAATLSLETAYRTIPQWDSVMHLRLVMEVEAKYGVSIPIEKVPEMKTLRDFHDVALRGK